MEVPYHSHHLEPLRDEVLASLAGLNGAEARVELFSTVEGVRAYGDITAVAISVYVLGLGLDGLFTSMVLFEAAFLGLLQLQIVREVGITIPSFPDLRANLEYSVPVAISSLAGNVSSRVDRIMIGFFLGASAVGVYSIAYQIAVAMSMYVKPIEQTFFPEFSDFIDENQYEKCAKYLRTGTRYFLIIAVPTAGGMFLIGPDVISILTAGQGTPSPYLVGVIALGITIGGAAGYYGGWVDVGSQRAIEIIRAFPEIPLWLALSAALPVTWSPLWVYFGITVILGLLDWPGLARAVRAKLLSLREEDFATAAQLMGARPPRIIFRHLLPSFASHLIASATLSIPVMILGETALSFLGLGLRPPITSWGVLLSEAQNINVVALYPWLMLPVVPVIVVVLAFNFLGDGLRDAADPYG